MENPIAMPSGVKIYRCPVSYPLDIKYFFGWLSGIKEGMIAPPVDPPLFYLNCLNVLASALSIALKRRAK